jgi:hypothetical protein
MRWDEVGVWMNSIDLSMCLCGVVEGDVHKKKQNLVCASDSIVQFL